MCLQQSLTYSNEYSDVVHMHSCIFGDLTIEYRFTNMRNNSLFV